jgi:hypothetical protein
MKHALAVVFMVMFLTSFTKSNEVSEATKQKMFCKAFESMNSTSHDYTVIHVKNSKTGVSKDVCVTVNLICGALTREAHDGMLYLGVDCKKYHDRSFVFANDSALWNIGFNDYSEEELKEVAKKNNVDSMVQQIKTGRMRHISFNYADKKYIAHLLFDRGVIATSGCFGTTVRYFGS